MVDNFEHREFDLLKQAIEPLLGSVTWRFTNHHLSHALLGFYASPFRSAIIMSYDAGGNDGVLNFYLGFGLDVKLLLRLPVNMGMPYNLIALLLPEVTGVKSSKSSSILCSDKDISPYTFQQTAAAIHDLPDRLDVVGRVTHSYAGKFMGYSALAEPQPEVQFWARQYIRSYLQNETAMSEAFSWLREFSCSGTEAQRILAASAQHEWTAYVEELLGKTLLSTTAILGQPLDGIVLTGGCALNVLANQRIYETFTQKPASNPNLPRSFYVPPASNDGGIVIGSVWSVMPPLAPQSLQYLGFPLFDAFALDEAASSRQARSLTELGGVEYLADLLAGGESWKNESKDVSRSRSKPIIAVVIGRQEVGPRALGHQSLLAVPDHDIKDRMNRLKARQSYRPVAPMIAEEALEEVFGQRIKSPYMTMAPLVRESVRERFPALAHVDGTARHQSVGAEDEPWIHALLLAIGKKTGLAALINTSFNSKGKPIVNTVRESLKMLDDLPDLDFVLIEDWLFKKALFNSSVFYDLEVLRTWNLKSDKTPVHLISLVCLPSFNMLQWCISFGSDSGPYAQCTSVHHPRQRRNALNCSLNAERSYNS